MKRSSTDESEASEKRPRRDKGLTTVEYAVAGTLITVAVVTAFSALGGSVSDTINIIDALLPG